MDFELVVVQGRSATNTIKLNDGVTLVGRHNECQLRIKSSQVSRKHCELFEKKGLLLVKDLGSANGTVVNGKKIDGQRVLEAGDQLSIGPVLLRVEKIGSKTAPAAGQKAASPADTAVTAAAAAAAATGDSDEFTIDFDEPTPETKIEVGVVAEPEPATPPAKAKAPKQDDDAIADFLMDMDIEGDDTDTVTMTGPVPKASAKSEPVKAAVEEKSAPGKAKDQPLPASTEPAESDDAIADFLLDIKVEDDE